MGFSENFISFTGFAAAAGTTFAFIPQVIHVVRTKETHSISLYMYIIFITGVLLWLIFGILIGSPPVVCANAITLILAAIILFYKIKYK